MSNDPRRLPGVSIVCVFNDLAVRQDCLDRSIAAYRGDVDVDYIPVDNREHAFSSAGAALNHGAAQARHEVVVFVHQDVYLHSIDRVALVGRELTADRWGLIGASGVPAVGNFIGRTRDRVQVIGESANSPQEVDSVDEVLFMVRRDRVLEHPLTEDVDLAWHAYAVEYGLRLRRLGFGVGAANLAVTHNSLTINLDRLDVAHRRVAALYPEQLPIRTTCGTIGKRSTKWRDLPVIRDHRWRVGWLIRSIRAHRARRYLRLPVVFSDIRTDVDLLDFSEEAPLNVINFDRIGGFAMCAGKPVRLTRRGSPVLFWAVSTMEQLLETVRQLSPSASVLVADLVMEDLASVAGRLPDEEMWLIGLQEGATWLLGGPVLQRLPSAWTAPQAVPLMLPSSARVREQAVPSRPARDCGAF